MLPELGPPRHATPLANFPEKSIDAYSDWRTYLDTRRKFVQISLALSELIFQNIGKYFMFPVCFVLYIELYYTNYRDVMTGYF